MGGEKRGPGGGGGGGGANKKRKYHSTGKPATAVPHNIRGFFVSCENGKEGRTANEMITALNEAYEELCPKPKAAEGGGGGDIQAELAAEVAELKEKKNAYFQKLEGETAKGMMFIKMVKSDEGPTPTELALNILNKIKASRERKSRYCMRFMPVEHTCFASKEELAKTSALLIKKHFPTSDGVKPVKFSVLYECRSSGPFDRMEMIDVVAKQVPAPHTVDLNNPDKTILVSFNKGTCMLGVLDDYVGLCKYNVNTLAMTDEERAAMLKASQEKAAAGSKPRPAKPTEPKADEAKAEEAKAEDAKAEEAKAEDAKAEEAKADEAKAEDAKAEDAKAEDAEAEPAADAAK